MGVPYFNALAGRDPLRISRQLNLPLQKLEVLSYQKLKTMHTIVSSFVWTQYRNVMDGQTDRIPLAITALCIASNADAL